MSQAASSTTKQRVSGVLLIDKPQGLTSQQVVSKVKYLFKSPHHDSKKAGHTGTLDPMATGLLPICLGEATKFSHYQLDANKSYEAIIKLGERTDTGDAEGQVVETASIPTLTDQDCLRIASQFMGPQSQTPPMYSALKKDGKKLYEYAREGIEIERPSRPITIYALSVMRVALDSIKIEVTCSKGTYVRVLGEDIAKALGTLGHLTALRRTQVGDFTIAQAIRLDQLEGLSLPQRFAQLLAVDACVTDLPTLSLDDEQWQRVRMGQRLNVYPQLTPELQQYLSEPNALLDQSAHHHDDVVSDGNSIIPNAGLSDKPSKDIRLINSQGDFIGLAQLNSTGRLQPKKIITL